MTVSVDVVISKVQGKFQLNHQVSKYTFSLSILGNHLTVPIKHQMQNDNDYYLTFFTESYALSNSTYIMIFFLRKIGL